MIRRNGFSLIEFSMVTLILGVAMVITVPVVLKSQTEARQLGCATRMGNLAKAVLAFENANGRMPVAGLVAPQPQSQAEAIGSYNERSGLQISWVVLTLPFQDQEELFNSFDLDLPIFQQSDKAIGSVIRDLQCPADNLGASIFQSYRRIALGNYVAFISPVHGEHEEYLPGALGGFEPGTLDGQRLAEISDGFGNTLMLTEVRRRPSTGSGDTVTDQRGAWALSWMASSVLSADVHSANEGGSDFFGLFRPYVPSRRSSFSPTPNSQSKNSVVDQINPCSRPVDSLEAGIPCTRHNGYGTGFTAAAPRSLHGGGVNMAYVDGRVVFVTDDIDFVLYGNLVSSNNGRPVFSNPVKLFPPRKANRN